MTVSPGNADVLVGWNTDDDGGSRKSADEDVGVPRAWGFLLVPKLSLLLVPKLYLGTQLPAKLYFAPVCEERWRFGNDRKKRNAIS